MLIKKKSFKRPINRVVIILIGAFFLFGCEPAVKQRGLPIDVPITLDKGGETVDFEFYITEDYFYSFGLKYFFDKENPGDVDGLLELIESHGIRRQVLVEVDVMIWAVADSKLSVIYKNTVPVIKTLSGGNGDYFKEIVELRLRPGVYRLRVENKIAREQFYNRKIAVAIERSYKGK